MADRYFTPALFRFLRDLAANNDRAWFKENQERYESAVRQPALDFITDYGPLLAKVSPHFTADARTVGGSLFRIQRDTRFSKDKTPYKLNTGMHFRHDRGADAHAPGFYLHLEPGSCFMGVGLWRPPSAVAYQIRSRIDAERSTWRKVAHGKRFTDAFALEGESLQRNPKGYGDDHPDLTDLKRKDFIATARLTQTEVTSADFMNRFHDRVKRGAPFMEFLCDAVGVPF